MLCEGDLWADFKKPVSTRTNSNFTRNGLLHHIPLCGLLRNHKSGFWDSLSHTLCKSWIVLWRHWLIMALLSWNGVQEDLISHKRLSNVFLECCEHKEGPVRSQMAFSHLCTSLYILILSPPSSRYHMLYHYPHYSHATNCSKKFEFRVFKLFAHTIQLIKIQVLINFVC